MIGIAGRVGALLPGREADFAALNESATLLLARRCGGASLRDRLFALQVLGDNRAVAGTWQRGRRVRGGAPLTQVNPRPRDGASRRRREQGGE